tara:strand:+ start:304 stop:534 length:231 start_codon:yes stop_codon:yes gene_type:complete
MDITTLYTIIASVGINTVRDTFEDAMKTLRTGLRNLVRPAEQFKELDIRGKKAIPENILAKSDLTDTLSLVTEAEE